MNTAAKKNKTSSGSSGGPWDRRDRGIALWVGVLVVNLVGFLFMYEYMLQDAPQFLCLKGATLTPCLMIPAHTLSVLNPGITRSTSPEVFLAAFVLAAVTTTLVAAPFVIYLTHGWFARYEEFRNSLKDGALFAYLRRFWSARLLEAVWDRRKLEWSKTTYSPDDPEPENPEVELFLNRPHGWNDMKYECIHVVSNVFETIYHEQFGLGAYMPPFALLVVITYIDTVAVVFTNHCGVNGNGCVNYFLDAPASQIIAALSGAYLFSVSDAVMNIRRRSLNTSDVYWYALRAFLAVPIGYFFSKTFKLGNSSNTWVEFLAFSIMILPIDVLMKQIRRSAYVFFSSDQKEEAGDQLLTLSGVTSPIVAQFLSEGVYSVEQVATTDPVLLSIRTGLPFRFILRIASLAIVRRHLGDAAQYLAPIGYADAVSIYELHELRSERPDEFKAVCEQIRTILSNHAGYDLMGSTVVSKLTAIAGEEYTKLIAKICPLHASYVGPYTSP